MEADGDERPVKAARGSKTFQCDAASCIAIVKGKLVSHLQHPSALLEDCRRAAVLIATFPLPERCAQAEVVIDRADLKQHGAHTLRVGSGGIVVRTVGEDRGDRPWVITHRRREKIPAIGAEEDAPSTD
jgi:competence protein ComEC